MPSPDCAVWFGVLAGRYRGDRKDGFDGVDWSSVPFAALPFSHHGIGAIWWAVARVGSDVGEQPMPLVFHITPTI